MARLASLNVARPREILWRGKTVRTAIFKAPAPGPLFISRLHLDGDGVADPRYHGGPDKAVYVYPAEHYPFWATQLSRRDLAYGTFGENFTTEGLLETEVRIGDVFEVGSARVQVTMPRTPCAKLGMRVGFLAFVRDFRASGRSGFYLRVLGEGLVAPGDAIARVATDPSQPTVAASFRASADES